MYIDATFTDNDYHKFLSWKYAGDVLENENQIQILSFDQVVERYDFRNAERNVNYIHPKNIAIKIRFWDIVRNEKRSTQYLFLNYHFKKYSGDKYDFLDFINWSIRHHNPACKDFTDMPEQRILEWAEAKRKELETEKTRDREPGKPLEKIKWIGTPSQFGYIFLELVEKGFIELPTTAQDGSYSKLAKLCFEYFDIKTTPDNLKKEMNPKKNSLSDTKRVKFTIPNISKLA